jgi:hypothetical protein
MQYVNKVLLILLFLLCSNARAQHPVALDSTTKIEKTHFSEKDILVDNDSIKLKIFEKNFKKKYTDTPFVYEYKTPEKNAWDRFKDWLASFLDRFVHFSNPQKSANIVFVLLKIIGAIIILIVIYLIVKAVMNKEGKWIFGRNSDKKIIHYDEVEKNLQLIDFEKLIAKTNESGEKRLSIRYYYLWLLKKMSAKELIVWDLEKTNSDYLYELKTTAERDEFEYLSYLYNYIWYGEFELDENTFEKAKTAFEKAIKKVGNV